MNQSLVSSSSKNLLQGSLPSREREEAPEFQEIALFSLKHGQQLPGTNFQDPIGFETSENAKEYARLFLAAVTNNPSAAFGFIIPPALQEPKEVSIGDKHLFLPRVTNQTGNLNFITGNKTLVLNFRRGHGGSMLESAF